MPTPAENAITRRDAILTELATFVAVGPDYSIDGVSVNRAAYRQSLIDELKSLNELIQQLQGPFARPQQLRAR